MTVTAYEFERLSSVSGFNNAVMHCKSLIGMLGEAGEFINVADLVNSKVADSSITVSQVNPIIGSLLGDKFKYISRSFNLLQNFTDFSSIQKIVVKWKALDIVLVYHHPELGIMAVNPKNPKSWESITQLKIDELLVFYVGAFGNKFDDKLADGVIQNMIALISGRKMKQIPALEKGKYAFSPVKEAKAPSPAVKPKAEPAKKPGRGRAKTAVIISAVEAGKSKETAAVREPERQAPPPPAAPTGRRTMSPMYSVPVTNELFHNGNVEAWKKIIASYVVKYPGSEVYIFYEGERIHDINTLFKWGKVKHGSAIMFAVAGDEIKDIAKLQRYLRQGASSRFEDFLRFPVNTVLKLF